MKRLILLYFTTTLLGAATAPLKVNTSTGAVVSPTSFDGSTLTAVDAITLDGVDSTSFATAAQGALADSATQSTDWDTQGKVETVWGTTLATDAELAPAFNPYGESYFLRPKHNQPFLSKLLIIGAQDGITDSNFTNNNAPNIASQSPVILVAGDSVGQGQQFANELIMHFQRLVGRKQFPQNALYHGLSRTDGFLEPLDWDMLASSGMTERIKHDYALLPNGSYRELAASGWVMYGGRDPQERFRELTRIQVGLAQEASAGTVKVQYSTAVRLENETWSAYASRVTWNDFTDGAQIDLDGVNDLGEFDINVTTDTSDPLVWRVLNTDASAVVKMLAFKARNEAVRELVAYNISRDTSSIVNIATANQTRFVALLDMLRPDLVLPLCYADNSASENTSGLNAWSTALSSSVVDPVVVLVTNVYNAAAPDDYSTLDATLYSTALANGWGWYSRAAFMGRSDAYNSIPSNIVLSNAATATYFDGTVHPTSVMARHDAHDMIRVFGWYDYFKVPYEVSEEIVSSAGIHNAVERQPVTHFSPKSGKRQDILFNEFNYLRGLSETVWGGAQTVRHQGRFGCVMEPPAGVTTSTDITFAFISDLDFDAMAAVGSQTQMALFSMTDASADIGNSNNGMSLFFRANEKRPRFEISDGTTASQVDADNAMNIAFGRTVKPVFGNGISVGIFRYDYSTGDLSFVVNGVELFENVTVTANKNWYASDLKLTLFGVENFGIWGAYGTHYRAIMFKDWLTLEDAYDYLKTPSKAGGFGVSNQIFAGAFNAGLGYLVRDLSGQGNDMHFGGRFSGTNECIVWNEPKDHAAYSFTGLTLADPGDASGLVRLGNAFSQSGAQYGELLNADIRPDGTVEIVNASGATLTNAKLVAMDSHDITSANTSDLTGTATITNNNSGILTINALPPSGYNYLGIAAAGTSSAGVSCTIQIVRR